MINDDVSSTRVVSGRSVSSLTTSHLPLSPIVQGVNMLNPLILGVGLAYLWLLLGSLWASVQLYNRVRTPLSPYSHTSLLEAVS